MTRLFTLLASCILWTSLFAQEPPLRKAEEDLRTLRFSDAVRKLSDLTEVDKKENADWLRALALYYSGEHQACIEACDAVKPESDWKKKAVYLKAEAFIARNRHREAVEIFAAQADDMFGPARKDGVAKLLEDYADSLSKQKGKQVPTISLRRAHALYSAAINLQVSPAMRERCRFKLIGIAEALKDAPGTREESIAYLNEFDSSWTGPHGISARERGKLTAKRLRLDSLEPSRPATVRKLLIESELAMGERVRARIYAEDFLALLKGKPSADLGVTPGDVAWLICRIRGDLRSVGDPQVQAVIQNNRAANMPLPSQRAPGNEAPFQNDVQLLGCAISSVPDIDLYVESLRDFMKEYPQHEKTADALLEYASILEQQGELEDAIEVHRHLLVRKDLNPAAGNREEDETSKRLRDIRASSFYQIGTLFFRMKRYDETITQWREYVRRYPNGSQWETAQAGIIDAEFYLGIDAVEKNDEAKARERFEAFLNRYPLDHRSRQILFIFGQFHHSRAARLERDEAAKEQIHTAYQKAIDEWGRLIGKYPRSEEASLASYQTGVVLTEKLDRVEDGLEVLRKLDWGNWAQPAQSRVKLLAEKSLAVTSERVWRTDEQAKVKVSVRNIAKLKVSRFTLSLEDFFRRKHRLDNSTIKSLDIDLIEPDKTWEVELKDFEKYKSFTREIDVPMKERSPGVCVIRVEGEDWQSSTVVMRSDIELVMQAAQREALLYVENARTGTPARAHVLVSNGREIIGQGAVGEDGVFRLKGDMIRQAADLCVYVSSAEGGAMGVLDLRGMTASMKNGFVAEGNDPGVTRRAVITTSKAVYLPGDTLRWHGMVRDVEDGVYVIPEGREYLLYLTDGDGSVLRQVPTKLDAAGVFRGEFVLPEETPPGRYRLLIATENRKEAHDAFFEIRSGEVSSTPRLALHIDQSHPLKGEMITGRVVARDWNNEPMADESVQLTFVNGRMVEGLTNAFGEFAFELKTANVTSGRIRFDAGLPKYDLRASAGVFLFDVSSALRISRLHGTAVAGEPFAIRFETVSRKGGEPMRELGYVVQKLPRDWQSHPVLEAVPWLSYTAKEPEPIDVLSGRIDLVAGEEEHVQSLTIEEKGDYLVKLSGVDDSGTEVEASMRLTVMDTGGEQQLFILPEEEEAAEGMSSKFLVHSGFDSKRALLTVSSHVIVEYRFIELKTGRNVLELPVTGAHWPNFHVSLCVLHNNRLHQAGVELEVERALKIEFDFPSKDLSPGEKIRLGIQTRDQNGKGVPANLHLRLFDAMLSDGTDDPAEYFRRATRSKAAWRIDSTSGFQFVGTSRKVLTDPGENSQKYVLVPNDQEVLAGINFLEFSNNPTNNSILLRNRDFVLNNGFLQSEQIRGFEQQGINTSIGGLTNSSGVMPSHSTSAGFEYVAGPRAGYPEIFGRLTNNRDSASVSLRQPHPVYDERWFSDITTDSEGNAHVEITLPEKERAWNLLATGVSGVNVFGAVKEKIATTLPLRVTLRVPRFLRFGDNWNPAALVENPDDIDREEEFVLRFGDTGEVLREKLIVPAKGTAHLVFDSIEVSPVRRFEWSLLIGGKTLASASTFVCGSGVSRVESVAPDDTEAENGEVIRYDIEKPLMFDYLVGVGEGTTPPGWRNRIESAALGQQLLAATGALRLARDKKEKKTAVLEERVRTLVGLLQLTQRDGGWSWNGIRDQRDTVTTSASLWGLVKAKELGFDVVESTFDKAVVYLQEALTIIPPEEPEKSAMILHALALRDKADFSVANRLHRDRANLGDTALAYLAATLHVMNRDEMAGQLVAILAESAQTGNGRAHWNGSSRVVRLSPDENTTAMALWTLAKLKSHPELRAQAAAFLLGQAGALPQATSRAHGVVVTSLSAHLSVSEDPGPLRAATIIDRIPSPEAKETFAWPKFVSRKITHEGMYVEDQRIGGSTSPVSHAEYGQVVQVTVKVECKERYNGYLVWDEPIPAGCVLVPGTLEGNFAKVETATGGLRLYFRPGKVESLRYRLCALSPGKFAISPARIRDAYRSDKFVLDEADTFEILVPGVKSPDSYEMNGGEQFALATHYFENGRHAEAEKQLLDYIARHKNIRGTEGSYARMLLSIECAKENPQSENVVKWFEVLNERHPQTEIPLSQALAVGRAYREMKEYERSWLLTRSAINGRFLEDSSVSGVLEDNGDYLGSIDLQKRLWREYPDTTDVISAHFALSQDLIQNAENVNAIQLRDDKGRPTREQLLEQGKQILLGHWTMYPKSEGVESAAFSLINVLFSLKDYAGMVEHAENAVSARPDSQMRNTFQYLAALGHFWQFHFDEALKAAAPVAESDNKDRDYARYITAQIHHAKGDDARAIEWYGKVKDLYSDAAESLEAIEEKHIEIPEVTAVHDGDVNLRLRYRNIKNAALQIYKVDLMKLYLREKNLGNITKVDLAGISSLSEVAIELGDGKDYDWREKEVKLMLKQEGAYLVICRGDDLFTSGLVLITPLKLEVRENIEGSVRLTVRDLMDGNYVADAEVKAVGSADEKVRAGTTDPRGALQLSGINGKATVIVRKESARYAFYRGDKLLGSQTSSGNDVEDPQPKAKPLEKSDYLKNIQTDNMKLQRQSQSEWKMRRMKGGKGIKAEKALKK